MNCKLSTVAVIKKFSFYSADVSTTPNLVMWLEILNFQINIFGNLLLRPSFRNIIKYKALDKHPNLKWNRKKTTSYYTLKAWKLYYWLSTKRKPYKYKSRDLYCRPVLPELWQAGDAEDVEVEAGPGEGEDEAEPRHHHRVQLQQPPHAAHPRHWTPAARVSGIDIKWFKQQF